MAIGMGLPSYFQSETLSRPECELVAELLQREFHSPCDAEHMDEPGIAAHRRRINSALRKLGCAALDT